VLPWVHVAPHAPYFVTDDGRDWLPIGQNDAIDWPELAGLLGRRDTATAGRYLDLLRNHGVTVLRLMLEYSQFASHYLEQPIGHFRPEMVQLWDDLFAMCEQRGLRILLTPYDTFWMWTRWEQHPYHLQHGGPCATPAEWLTCTAMREAIKRRLAFATQRWGKSGALFAWDIWNEIHPAHAGESIAPFADFIEDISVFLRDLERSLHGRTHPQTVSIFGPLVYSEPSVAESVMRHPRLDFASTHLYEHGSIDAPRNTVDAAISVGRLVRDAVMHAGGRPYFDSEHGPIHAFKDHEIMLDEPFDDEYFRHMQWAHAASGGAGGGMRWPNRHPHSLTPGMREAQAAFARYQPLIDWQRFQRRCVNDTLAPSHPAVAAFGCSDASQAILYLLRTDLTQHDGTLRKEAAPIETCVHLHGMQAGDYRITAWDTRAGSVCREWHMAHDGAPCWCLQSMPIAADLALAITRK
jgi:mannan endo-1,4-beta-mannosidase